jgi:hypothetical protein
MNDDDIVLAMIYYAIASVAIILFIVTGLFACCPKSTENRRKYSGSQALPQFYYQDQALPCTSEL